jgi:hypothetical protein
MKFAVAGRHAARFVQTFVLAAAGLSGAAAEAAVAVYPKPHEVRELGGAPVVLSAASRTSRQRQEQTSGRTGPHGGRQRRIS